MKEQLKILLLAGNTLRARAYAQSLPSAKNVEVSGILFGFETRACNVPELDAVTQSFLESSGIFIPDFSIPLEDTFKANHWAYSNIVTDDVYAPITVCTPEGRVVAPVGIAAI